MKYTYTHTHTHTHTHIYLLGQIDGKYISIDVYTQCEEKVNIFSCSIFNNLLLLLLLN